MKDFAKEVLTLLTSEVKAANIDEFLNGERIVDKRVISVDDRRFSKVARVSLITETGLRKNCYVKKSIPNKFLNETEEEIRNRIVHEFQFTKRVHYEFRDIQAFYIPSPISIFSDKLIYIIEECPGISLSNLIRKNAVFWSSIEKKNMLLTNMEMVGKWLKIFHEKFCIKDSVFSLEDMKSYCSLRLEKILKKGLINKTLSSRILRYFDNTILEIPECDLKMSVAHCDFSPGNVIVNEGNIGVIDFARAQPWSVFLDITHLYYQLNLLVYKYVFGKMFVNRLKDAFLRGYENTELKNNKLFTLFLIQNKLCKLVYFSRKEEHSFKSNLYHKIIINDTRKWFENIC